MGIPEYLLVSVIALNLGVIAGQAHSIAWELRRMRELLEDKEEREKLCG